MWTTAEGSSCCRTSTSPRPRRMCACRGTGSTSSSRAPTHRRSRVRYEMLLAVLQYYAAVVVFGVCKCSSGSCVACDRLLSSKVLRFWSLFSWCSGCVFGVLPGASEVCLRLALSCRVCVCVYVFLFVSLVVSPASPPSLFEPRQKKY